MLILGISGLHRSLAVKQSLIAGLEPRERRMAQGLDSAAALVSEDGVVAAAAQERFSGDKGTNLFPRDAIEACLRAAGIGIADVDAVAHGFRYEPTPLVDLDTFSRRWFDEVYCERAQLDVLGEQYPDIDWRRKLVRVPHHLAHAASAYHLSGFEAATVLVADGSGETESTTVFAGSGPRLERLRSYPLMSSLGLLYGIVTHYLGFLPGMDEYKVMGLAPYGDWHRHADTVEHLVRLGPDGALAVPLLAFNKDAVERETNRGALRRLGELLGPPRDPDEPIEQRHMDIAATVQHCLEEALLHVLRPAVAGGPPRPLCLAGGVALNCTANGVLAASGLFSDIFVQPAAGDDGTALGAALWTLHERASAAPRRRMGMPYWGDAAAPGQIEEALAGLGPGYRVERLGPDDLVDRVADRIADGSVVAWFQGRMEFGPRALGNRSILADPGGPLMRAHLNDVVKQREEFRPFAPAVPAEDAARYFEIEPGREHMYQHMLFVAPVRAEYRDRLPAVTHVDGSARVQVVGQDSAPLFWRLLRRFGERRELPVLLNTSFNLRGQPIVRTAAEAVATYARSRIDVLAIGDFLVTRPGPLRDRAAGVWREFLAVDGPADSDHFFDLGGHSALAVEVALRLRELTGTDVPLDVLFEHPRFGELLAALEAGDD
ncbi:carbamoyltransferase C-terminal domain-containing protein [Actinoplanes sp. N902-109]|uniref:carbamoyltransferase family protein n=1 Tax=Actinoplanes sp. (strain N902-109) TaxID=649831 RepID=UPI0003295357|nr:carbamoyltransferase C-terminal domain-containing protein [Actinoplanes sp. N902-109]AGL19081.1 carbamoyltransferase [Actinoplanes sp. N902-109]